MDKLTLFTKDKCIYCVWLKEKLDDWGYEYVQLNNHPLPTGKDTYPQLYYRDQDVQQGSSTDLTENVLLDRVERLTWPRLDSGIE